MASYKIAEKRLFVYIFDEQKKVEKSTENINFFYQHLLSLVPV